MAKKRPGRGGDGVNKSAAIREVFDLHGLGVKSKDVIGALAARGITVSSAHVANERSRQLLKSKRKPAAAAQATSANGRRGRKPASSTPTDSQAVRKWAQANGIEVSARGRIPTEIVERYRAAGN